MGDEYEGTEESSEDAREAQVGIKWSSRVVEEIVGINDEKLLRVRGPEPGEEAQNSKVESGFVHILLINNDS